MPRLKSGVSPKIRTISTCQRHRPVSNRPVVSLSQQTFRRYTTGPSSSRSPLHESCAEKLRQWMSIAYKGYPALTGIVLVNTAVFFIWQNRENADVMARHFVHKDQDLSQGYWYTVLTSGFSQEGLLHFGSNMLFLCTLGRHAVPLLGNGGFLAAYACLTVASSLATRAYHTYIYPRHHNHKSGYQSHGASGAVLGLLGFIGVAVPHVRLFTDFGLSYHNYFVIAACVAGETIGALSGLHCNCFGDSDPGLESNIDYSAHLGGLITGIMGGIAMRMVRKM